MGDLGLSLDKSSSQWDVSGNVFENFQKVFNYSSKETQEEILT